MPDPSSRLIQARVVKAYAKRAPNELSLSVGDELLVFDATNASMWFGQLQSRGSVDAEAEAAPHEDGTDPLTGWFPAGNCVPVGTPALPSHPSNTSSKGGVRLSMRIDAATFRNQLTAALGDPGIIVGTQIPGVPSPRLRKHARALHDYAAESPSELSINAGDIISLLSCEESESWWEGELASGSIGYFPKDFVQVFRDPSTMATPRTAAIKEKTVDCKEFDDPHALAIIAQVVTAHEPVVPFNNSGTPFLELAEGAVVALLDSNPNHMYWMAVHFNENMAPTRKSLEQGEEIDISAAATSSSTKSARVGLVPKANLAVFEGLAEPTSNYPFTPVPLGITRVLANRAFGSVQTMDGYTACLARITFEFMGENENEHEYLGVGDLVWVLDDDDAVRQEAWIDVEIDTRRGFCPASFVEVLSDRVQTPKLSATPEPEGPTSGTGAVLASIQEFDVAETSSNEGDESPSPAPQSDDVSPDSSASPDPTTSQPSDALSRIRDLSIGSMPAQAPPPTPGVSNTTVPVQAASEAGSTKKSKKKPKDAKDSSKDSATKESVAPATEGPHSTSSATIARALYNYAAESNNELTLSVGDIIRLIDYPANEEWWEGILMAPDGSPLSDESIGFFPRDFVVILANPNREKKKKRPKRGASISGSKKKSKIGSASGSTKDSESDEGIEPSAGKSSRSKRLEAENESLKSQLDSMELDAEAKQAEIESVMGELEASQAELRSAKETLEAIRQESRASIASLATSRADFAALQQSFSMLEGQHKDTAAFASKLEQSQAEELKLLKVELETWRARAESAESQVTSLQADLADARASAASTESVTSTTASNSTPQNQPPAGPPPSSALPATPKARGALPPTPATTPGSATPQRPTGAQPKLPSNTTPQGSPVPALGHPPAIPKLAAAPKRSLPPSQPAPSLPVEFVKKTAAPTSGIRAASHISAQSAAAGTKKAGMSVKRTGPPSGGMQHSSSNYSTSSNGTQGSTPTSSGASSPLAGRRIHKVSTPGVSSVQSGSPASSSLPGTPTNASTPTTFKPSNAGARMSSYAKHEASIKSSPGGTQPPPKVLDEFENKRRFFESLK